MIVHTYGDCVLIIRIDNRGSGSGNCNVETIGKAFVCYHRNSRGVTYKAKVAEFAGMEFASEPELRARSFINVNALALLLMISDHIQLEGRGEVLPEKERCLARDRGSFPTCHIFASHTGGG